MIPASSRLEGHCTECLLDHGSVVEAVGESRICLVDLDERWCESFDFRLTRSSRVTERASRTGVIPVRGEKKFNSHVDVRARCGVVDPCNATMSRLGESGWRFDARGCIPIIVL